MSDARLLTVPEAAQAAGLSAYILRRMINRSELPTILVNGRHRVHPAAVANLRSKGLTGTERMIAEPAMVAA
jgi:hypothetical protein